MRILIILLLLSTQVMADKSKYLAHVVYVAAMQIDDGSWCFKTSVKHNDQGWEHYADGWEVTDLKGIRLGYREITHPLVNEQPFTRRQCEIKIPVEINKVIVRARNNINGYGGQTIEVDLNNMESTKYSVKRWNF
jgi:hypothetical protein